jgi:hypothetical protein
MNDFERILDLYLLVFCCYVLFQYKQHIHQKFEDNVTETKISPFWVGNQQQNHSWAGLEVTMN